MAIKYRTNYAKDNIKEVEITRETNKSVFFLSYNGKGKDERSERKESKYCMYFDTWVDAHLFLLNSAHKRVKSAEFRFECEMKLRTKIEAMTQNKEAITGVINNGH